MSNQPKVDRQREHQANERTFLAWLRTSIALIGFGFALARFGLFLRQLELALTPDGTVEVGLSRSEILGISLVVFGIIAIALAAWRYNQVFWQIERSDYRPNRLPVWVVTGAVIILGILSLPLLIWRDNAVPARRSLPFPSETQD
ncbi:DUF202 domain-containing protein [Desertifilum sp. FACHB-1129]|uniref:DUF202 domain-containing protein n=2 Tax=Desertifilum tharense IPPAS B-1220 TaxID=1781255 RepID=A0A1E5QJB0_9CYAN|nr:MULTISPECIES: DUF202 domain-containing protein [Desertifilum]MCD8490251.1 DUF202 domain-containing protein [Desertifilum sp.]MDA0211541.1 DUF202 domain-containing protein [Cyanobacteria bacterium FC1]MDI9635808.1 DUF202 domain-containing protein [Geitlerinema splendidum]MBD2310065.1 DUF202 domain-containing protein [Desertifilum sp. FACHB-1129]MBD2322131.1 DUF202 domain-containing protein [Desertifilum sp. FACHB-866]